MCLGLNVVRITDTLTFVGSLQKIQYCSACDLNLSSVVIRKQEFSCPEDAGSKEQMGTIYS